MTKMTNKDLIITVSVGILATIILVVVFQSSFSGKKATLETDVSANKTDQATTTEKQLSMESFEDKNLGIAFQYPKGLKIITDGNEPINEPLWLEISSLPITEAKQDDYWKENLNKLAIGEAVVLPGDIYIKKTALQASAGSYPVSIYTEVSLKNCQENYANKLIALIDDKIVILKLRQSSASVASDLKELKATSTTENLDCNKNNLDIYNTDLLVEKIKSNEVGVNILGGLQTFRTILASIVITKIKPEPVASTTSGIIKVPAIDKKGNLSLEVDKVIYLFGEDAKKQMKEDKVCTDDCQVPEGGYLVNQSKKYTAYNLSASPYISINVSTSTPAQTTQTSLPGLIDYLKQNKGDKTPVFDVFMDESGKQIVGLKQH